MARLLQIVAAARHFFALSAADSDSRDCQDLREAAVWRDQRGGLDADGARGVALRAPRLERRCRPGDVRHEHARPAGPCESRRVISPPAQIAIPAAAGGAAMRGRRPPAAPERRRKTTTRRPAPRARAPRAGCPRSASARPSEMHCAPSGTSSASTISRPRPCCSPGNVVSSTLGAPSCRGNALIAGAQRDLQLLGVEVLLEHREIAAHPRVADRVVERSQRFEHEALQSLPHQQVRERFCSAGASWPASSARISLSDRRRVGSRRGATLPSASALSSSSVCADDLAGPQPDIHQPLDRAELGDFRRGIPALAVVVAQAALGKPYRRSHIRRTSLDSPASRSTALMLRARPAVSVGGFIVPALTRRRGFAYNCAPRRTSSAG